jgi:hypothetical protein
VRVGRRDADDLTARVDQGTAEVLRLDRSVNREIATRGRTGGADGRTDQRGRGCGRPSDHGCRVSDVERVRVAEGEGWQAASVDPQDGDAG